MAKCRELIGLIEKKKGRKLTVYNLVVGCQMNAKDSEKIQGILTQIGFEKTDAEETADMVIYNTCTVRENANLKVYGRLGYLNSLKRERPDMLIAMCGCMMQEKHVVDTIKEKYRFVDIVFGTYNIYKTAELLYLRLTGGNMVIDIWNENKGVVEELPAVREYPFKSGVNIMYGCNNFCTFCIVPYVRGREKSRTSADIIDEIKKLVKDGVREVMLLGQNVNSYGKGLEEDITFSKLLYMVNDIEGLERIRFMTSHPKDLSDDLIYAIRDCKKVCRHFHLPLQSGSDTVLKRMNRHYDQERYLGLVKKLRDTIPDIAITTDIIVGFPGETDEDFEETMKVVEEARFDGAFTFIYSKRTGTPAASYPDQVSADIVKKRFDRLLSRVQAIAAEKISAHQGKVMDAMVEGMDDHLEGYVTGRLSNNVMVHFPGDGSLIGKIVPVMLKESKGFYYIGEMV
ncbi:MAG: tRNA (N6-isopentenyl adenosine(37)-C2)-methylthiotransferase MiaB [Lachnospiraceae bacterium]|nr:tRNA (N6-isopentenyl adenosine(37)-C2)-methylthiotransferase MiaB [Lachnospiraceae bacterium]